MIRKEEKQAIRKAMDIVAKYSALDYEGPKPCQRYAMRSAWWALLAALEGDYPELRMMDYSIGASMRNAGVAKELLTEEARYREVLTTQERKGGK